MSQSRARSTRAQGNLVEEIATKMHERSGVKVEMKKRLPIRVGNLNVPSVSRTKREIDILVTVNAGGCEVQIPIECKNETKPIGPKEIGDFITKLNQVGLPVMLGVFIVTSGYTQGAQDTAQAAGIRLLEMTGLTSDRLDKAVLSAVQSVIHLMVTIDEFTLTSSVGEGEHPNAPEMLHSPVVVFDEDKQVRGTLVDLIWRMWIEHKLPNKLGRYDIDVDIPPRWCQFMRGPEGDIPDPLFALQAKVNVIGVVVTVHGTGTDNQLVDYVGKTTERGEANYNFPSPDQMADSEPPAIHIVHNEEELDEHIKAQQKDYHFRVIVGRILLPRIYINGVLGPMFWPPSQPILSQYRALVRENGGNIISPEQIEKSKLGFKGDTTIFTVWDPIAPDWKLPW